MSSTSRVSFKMSTPGQASRMAKSDLTLHASFDISISLGFNIRIVWAARVNSSCGIPAHSQIVRASLVVAKENERGHLAQYPPIQASGYDRGTDAVETVDKQGAKRRNTGNQRKGQMILQGCLVRVLYRPTSHTTNEDSSRPLLRHGPPYDHPARRVRLRPTRFRSVSQTPIEKYSVETPVSISQEAYVQLPLKHA
jgi:hypothetical protein